MAVNRQQSLFAAEDWTVAYKAFSQVDFQAYDFDSIRSALVEYVRTNFPENFNDYIESSEFIAIIELLAYLSQSLAFRMDVNTRENFLETAERRDSVFKLARMLGYNPKRNIPASGLLKLISIKTTEQLRDSVGNDLNNRTIYWDDSNNTQSYEQFITVMNAAMSSTNRFTAPIKQGTITGINTELYQLNTPIDAPISYNFSLAIDGANKPFNVVNPDFVDNSHFYERHPDPSNLFNIIYRNDGKGISSKDTGFFVMFRQGVLQFQDFNYTSPVVSRQEDIAVQNINESDVYLQEINTNGLVLNKWEKIPNTVGQTLNYNSKLLNTRNLYAVENLSTDGIRIRYPDGNFGNVPVGIYRLWYRTSDPTRFTIQPDTARAVTFTIPYVSAKGTNEAVTITAKLQYAVGNSLPPESLAAIKQRAPQVFYTQNRMVNAQDYNVFPQSQSSNITKLKATNRTHAGHSRYIDINDPTGSFQNVDTFADDAFLYVNDNPYSSEIVVNNNTTPLEVTTSIIPNSLKLQGINNFVYYNLRNIWSDPDKNGNLDMFRYDPEVDAIKWNALPIRSESKTGFFTEKFSDGNENVMLNLLTETRMIRENAFIKLIDPDNYTNFKWVRITGVENNGQLTSGLNTAVGPWTLSEEVPAGWLLVEVIVSLRKLFTQGEAQLIEDNIRRRYSFALGYHLTQDRWYVIPNTALSIADKTSDYEIDSSQGGSRSWLILLEYQPVDQFNYKYTMTMRSQDYVIQSESDLKFYNVKNVKVVDSTNKSSQDTITFTTVNTKPSESELYEWTGNAWRNRELGTVHEPRSLRINLPLKTRDTDWRDVRVKWISNFGLFELSGGTTLTEYVINNKYVTDAVVPLNTFYPVGGITTETNVVITNNTGQITSLPNKITIPFNNQTFGTQIVDTIGTPYIVYRQLPDGGSPGTTPTLIFKGEVGQPAISYGVDGTTPDPSVTGRLQLKDYDLLTGTGNLVYSKIQFNDFHYSFDVTNQLSRDKILVEYINNKDKLDDVIKWQIVDVFKEADGYVDPRKVKVAPLDTDSDLVPDRPRQFAEFVGPADLVLFEYYTDFDGYIYDRPVNGVVADYRNENTLDVNNSADKISPGSYRKFQSLSNLDWILVKNKAIAEQYLVGKSNASGLVVYAEEENTVYQLVPLSTTLSTNPNDIILSETSDYFVKQGRGKNQNTAGPETSDGIIRWSHVAPNDVRIDPSISNIVEMIILTTSYNNQVKTWMSNKSKEFPLEPTSNELSMEFAGLNTYKSASDTIVYRSAKFKLLFGTQADDAYRAKFKVVKLSDQLSDNELKTRIISAINEYFDVANWEFGETFYFTELSTYIHQRLGSAIGSIVISPVSNTSNFGELFQVKAEPNELFISTASVNDIELISRLDNKTLRSNS